MSAARPARRELLGRVFWIACYVLLLSLLDIQADRGYEHGDNADEQHGNDATSYSGSVILFSWNFLHGHGNAEALLAVFTILLMFVTAGLWFHTRAIAIDAEVSNRKQAKLTRRSLKIAQEAAEAATKTAKIAEDSLLIGERAHVFVTGVSFDSPIDRDTFDYQGPEVWPWAIYSLENHGRTPAVVTEFCYESLCVEALPDIPEYRETRIHDQLWRVYARDSTAALKFVFKTPIDGRVLVDIGMGTRQLFAYGYIRYTDIFNYENTVGYCWRYNLSLARFLPHDDPAYNYQKAEGPK